MSDLRVTSKGIRKALKKFSPEKAITEYIWNGFDAKATTVSININYISEGFLKSISSIDITDNGTGINYKHLTKKFMPFFDSEKARQKQDNSSAVQGQHGYGRLTFHKFSTSASWNTTYYDEEHQRFSKYTIDINSQSLNNYLPTSPTVINNFSVDTGTTVTFRGISQALPDSFFENKLIDFIKTEFAWFLELNKSSNFQILVNGSAISYCDLISEQDTFSIAIPDEESLSNIFFQCTFILWSKKLNDEYSRFYFKNSNDKLKYLRTTRLNNRGDKFYHSLYVKSGLFDELDYFPEDNDFDEGSEPIGQIEQNRLFDDSRSKNKIYEALIKDLNSYLKKKRKPFLHSYAHTLINELENDRVMPEFGNNSWDKIREGEFKTLVGELYEVEPKLFINLNIEQKKTFLHLLNLLMDSSQRDDLFKVLENVIELDSEDRKELASILKSTKLNGIISAIKLVHDRLQVLDGLKSLVFNTELNANEVNHLQKLVEDHYWIFGEQYALVCSAEVKFETALKRHIYLLKGEIKDVHIDHPSRLKEMDIFIIRQNPLTDMINNVVVELKHPIKNLGEKELSQVKEYMSVIKSEDEFNASNFTWDFYLVGNRYNDRIAGEIENAKSHGEKSLAFKRDNYKIFVKTWSEIINEVELRLNWLNNKLQVERELLTLNPEIAQDVLDTLLNNTSISPAAVNVPINRSS